MTQSMIEKMGRALQLEDIGPVSAEAREEQWEAYGDEYKQQARAALECLLEPTDEMVDIVSDCLWDYDPEYYRRTKAARGAIQAMIRKALEE